MRPMKLFLRFQRKKEVMVAGYMGEWWKIILSAYADETKHQFKLIVVPWTGQAAPWHGLKAKFFFFFTDVDKSLLGLMDNF